MTPANAVDPNALRDEGRELSGRLRQVRDALADLEVAEMAAGERDDLERMLAAATAAVREQQSRELGVRREPGWDPDGPVVRSGLDGRLSRIRGRLVDHLRREYRDGSKVYVSEPYSLRLGSRSLDHLAQLAEDWCIHLSPRLATHFPGRTVVLSFAERAE